MSSSPVTQRGAPAQGFLSQASQTLAPVVSAAAAIVVPFRWFVQKSDLQQRPQPSMQWDTTKGLMHRVRDIKVLKPEPIRMAEGLIQGVKAAPTIGAIVGTQMVVQEKIENLLLNRVTHETNSKPSLFQMAASCALVGFLSVPLLAIFNGQTLGWSAKKSLQELSLKQGGAIVGKETSFVLSQRVSEPVANKMKEVLGDKPGVQSAAEFASGAIGSIVGHPLDTELTRLQKSLPPAKGLQRMNGGLIKAIGVGVFTVISSRIKELLQGSKK